MLGVAHQLTRDFIDAVFLFTEHWGRLFDALKSAPVRSCDDQEPYKSGFVGLASHARGRARVGLTGCLCVFLVHRAL